MNKLQSNCNKNSYIFIHENTCQNVVYRRAAILFQPQCDKIQKSIHELFVFHIQLMLKNGNLFRKLNIWQAYQRLRLRHPISKIRTNLLMDAKIWMTSLIIMFAVRPICVQDSIFKMSSESPAYDLWLFKHAISNPPCLHDSCHGLCNQAITGFIMDKIRCPRRNMHTIDLLSQSNCILAHIKLHKALYRPQQNTNQTLNSHKTTHILPSWQKYKTFYSRKCIWKCCLWNGGHFVHGEMS